MDRNFITKNQTLIVFDVIGGKQYPVEIERRKTFPTINDILAELGDETVQVLRMFDNPKPDAIEQIENLKIEDITEACADAWLRVHEDNWFVLRMGDDVPPFIAGSQAWKDYCDENQPSLEAAE